MPLAEFRCAPCRCRFEELFTEDIPETHPCPRCSAPAKRRFTPLRVIGPTTVQLEDAARARLGPRELARGARMRGARDIEAFDRELYETQGLRRIDPDSPEYKRNQEAMREVEERRARIARQDGEDAVLRDDLASELDDEFGHLPLGERTQLYNDAHDMISGKYDAILAD